MVDRTEREPLVVEERSLDPEERRIPARSLESGLLPRRRKDRKLEGPSPDETAMTRAARTDSDQRSLPQTSKRVKRPKARDEDPAISLFKDLFRERSRGRARREAGGG